MAEINGVFIDKANHIYIVMPMYNLIEDTDNYSDTSGSLLQFKRDEVPPNDDNLTINYSRSFKYKAALLGRTENENNGNSFVKNIKTIAPLKY